MFSLIFGLIGLAKNFLAFKTRVKELDTQNQQQATAEFWQYQTEYIKMTSGIETRLVRQIVILAFVAGLFSPAWMAILTANAKNMPIMGWFFITWEFIGAEALYVLPWFKGFSGSPASNGNGNMPDPSIPEVVTPPPQTVRDK